MLIPWMSWFALKTCKFILFMTLTTKERSTESKSEVTKENGKFVFVICESSRRSSKVKVSSEIFLPGIKPV